MIAISRAVVPFIAVMGLFLGMGFIRAPPFEGAGVSLQALAMIALFLVMLLIFIITTVFSRPRFLIPPPNRNDPSYFHTHMIGRKSAKAKANSS
jgi:hypothetical protein